MDIPLKNLPLKKRNQKTHARKYKLSKEKQAELQKKAEQQELTKANKLAAIQKESERYDAWKKLPKQRQEIEIFEPDEFVKKQIGEVDEDIKNDIERLKTKLFHPDQFDSVRAKEAFEAEISTDYEKSVTDLKEATQEFNVLAEKEKGKKRKSKKLLDLEKRIQQLESDVQIFDYQKQWVPILLPFDSIYALRTKYNLYTKQDEYYAVVKNPDGSFKEKLVSRDWLEINIDSEFLEKFDKTEKESGWIMFSETDDSMKVIKEATGVRDKLKSNNLKSIYTYQPKAADDEIHCLRVCVEMVFPYHKLKALSHSFAVMTAKDSLSQSPKVGPNNNPWEYRNKHDIKCHIYTDITHKMLEETIGEMFYGTILDTISDTFKAEYSHQGIPHVEPTFDFSGSHPVAKYGETSRFIDSLDLEKPDSMSKKPIFYPEFCGVFAHRQYYYYDFTKLKTKYYVNVSTTQIKSLRWRPEFRQFWGLERTYVNGVEKFKHVVLENEWVEKSFEKEVLKTVRQVGESNKNRYVKLPIGKGKKIVCNEVSSKYPEMVYKQYNDNTCVFVSIANALHYLQFEDVALQIDDEKRKVMKKSYRENFERLMEYVANFLNTLCYETFRKTYTVKKITDTKYFNIIESGKQKPNILYHVVLRSIDGGETHAVAVVHNYIFDGNFTHAMPLTQLSLDKICDSKFVGVVEGYKYICIK
jgi:hypothetical protein